jgi:hypothetical protein
MFKLDTTVSISALEWVRAADGPIGASLAYFIFQSITLDSRIWLHGGIGTSGAVKSLLWSVQFFAGQDPLWSLQSIDGPARAQHCACTVGDTVYIWGGRTGRLCMYDMNIYTCMCMHAYG